MMVNKNRAYFNSSFDKRMMKYAQKRSEQQKRKQKWKSSTKYILPTEMSLPSPETIRQQNPDEAAIRENMELMDYNDSYSDSENDNETKRMKIEATDSVAI